MLEGVAAVTYFAPNLDEYWRWLEQVLDAQLERRHQELVQGRIGSVPIVLHPADEKGPPGPGGQVVYWQVADLAAALICLEAHGGRRYPGPIRGLDGRLAAQVRDPVGNVWGLVQIPSLVSSA